MMNTEEKLSRKPCKKLHELPAVSTEWQNTTWCPDCEYYDRGTCGDPTRTDSNATCPLDGKPLPLREVSAESNDVQPHAPLRITPNQRVENRPESTALELTIKREIITRTGGRIELLEVQQIGREVVIRGNAPCYYIKQLALQGVLDVIRSTVETDIEVNVQVVVCPATGRPDTP